MILPPLLVFPALTDRRNATHVGDGAKIFPPGERVGVVRPLEDGLKGLELAVAERRPVPSRPFVAAVEIVQRRVWK